MIRKEEHIDIVYRFLNNELSVEQIADFKNRIKEDDDLKREFLFQKSLSHSMPVSGEADFHQKLLKIEKEDMPTKVLFRSKSLWYSIAAVLVVLIAAWFIFNPNSDSLSNQELYSKYYTTYQFDVESRSNNDSSDFYTAVTLFNNKEFQKAKDLLIDILKNDSLNNLATIQLAIIEMEQSNFTKAEELLLELSHYEPGLYTHVVNWHLSLCYLQLNERDISISLLKKLSSKNNRFSKKASQLLEELE